MLVLHPFSGGVDSTAALLKLVDSRTPCELLHVSFAHLPRGRLERRAIGRILAWFAQNRSHVPALHVQPIDDAGRREADIINVARFVGPMLCHRPEFTHVSLSTTVTDRQLPGWTDRHAGRVEVTQILSARHPQWYMPNWSKTRAQIRAELPAELLALTWSCRKPVDADGPEPRRCGACAPCRLDAANSATAQEKGDVE